MRRKEKALKLLEISTAPTKQKAKVELKLAESHIKNRADKFDSKIAAQSKKLSENHTQAGEYQAVKDRTLNTIKQEKQKIVGASKRLVKEKRDLYSKLGEKDKGSGHHENILKFSEQREKIKALKEELSVQKEALSSSLQGYLKEEQQELKTHLERLRFQESNLLKDRVATKLNALVLDNLQTSVRGAMGSSLYDRQRLGLLKHKAGTCAGELLRMFQQFTTTSTGLFLTHMVDLPNASKMPKGASMALENVRLKYVSTMVLSGILIAIVKSLIRGEDPLVSDVLKEATLNNGALIPYADKLMSLYTDYGHPLEILGKTSGATLQAGINVVTALGKSGLGVKGASKDVVLAARNITPLMRMWYTQTAFEYAVNHFILEELNPGYLERKQQKREKAGVGFFQSMGE